MHRNAPLTPEGRLRLCRLIEEGWTVASAAESFRTSRQTAHKWWRRYPESGEPGLVDRPSRPRRCPTKTPAKVERRVVELRRRHQVSAARLAERAGLPASTLHQIWTRHGVSRLSDLERRSGRVIRRIETSHPGELVHIDIKKQAKIPKGGGWKVHGKAARNLRAGRVGGPASATPTSTRPSTPIPVWPTRRSTPTSRRSPPSAFGAGPGTSSPPMASPSSGYSQTTGPATDRMASGTSSSPTPSSTPGPRPTALRPMGK